VTWLVFEAEHPGRYVIGVFGEFESGLAVCVADDVAVRLLGPRGHPGFRVAREDEIPGDAIEHLKTLRPVGRTARMLARLGEHLRERAETVANRDAEEEVQ